MELKQDKSFHYWQFFAYNHQEELYDVISSMIKNYIELSLPQLVSEEIQRQLNNLHFNIETSFNGKSSRDLKNDVYKLILEELQK